MAAVTRQVVEATNVTLSIAPQSAHNGRGMSRNGMPMKYVCDYHHHALLLCFYLEGVCVCVCSDVCGL
jgi:hypothetical protein